MKKKILGFTIIATTVIISAWNINRNSHTVSLSDLALDNIEALASGEGSENHSSYHYDPVLNKNICNGPGSSC